MELLPMVLLLLVLLFTPDEKGVFKIVPTPKSWSISGKPCWIFGAADMPIDCDPKRNKYNTSLSHSMKE